MSKKQDEKMSMEKTAISPEVSGGNVEDPDFENITLKVASPEVKSPSLIESMEIYAAELSSAQKAAIREYRITCFPNLFTIRGYKLDVSSKHPTLELSAPAKFYAALREENIRVILKKVKEKKIH